MKIHVRDQLKLAELIYDDATAKCIAANPFRKFDLKTINLRVEKEGLSFLTITLPAFNKDFERSLEQGFIELSHSFMAFSKARMFSALIPSFLRGITVQLFDKDTGRLLDDVRNNPMRYSTYVEAIRQICLSFKKIEIPCTSLRTYKAVSNFVTTEQDLSSFKVPDAEVLYFRETSRQIWDPIVSNIILETLEPKHGPGQTAEHISGNQKYNWQFWYERLDTFFPSLPNGYSISAAGEGEWDQLQFISPEHEVACKVTPVPKTQKGPRIIAMEPCCMQYAQQAVRAALYERIELGDLVRGHVNFTDQTINQRLAMKSSLDRSMATLDLSDASDRVYHELAISMFDSHPDLRDLISACRSTHALLPGGQKVGPLVKFASMGNALCFPVEAMYFYTICVASLLMVTGRPVNRANVLDACSMVYVYGDDIIVPREYAISIRDSLQKYNCKVNFDKSFWSGNFRESCGVDAFGGMEVTPTYIRSLLPTNRRQAQEIISIVASANLFYKKGYWRTSFYLFERIEKILGPLPYVSETSPVLGRNSFLGYRSFGRWNVKFQRREVSGWTPVSVYRTDRLTGYAALTKCFLSEKSDIFGFTERDPLHLERSARPGAVTLQRRWVDAYL
jgi:hypothetical protein